MLRKIAAKEKTCAVGEIEIERKGGGQKGGNERMEVEKVRRWEIC